MLSVLQFHALCYSNLQCSVKEESLDLIDENGVEHSSPGSIATNLEDYMKLQLAEKDNSIEGYL